MNSPSAIPSGIDRHQVAQRVQSLVTELTLDEKAAITAGSGIFALQGAERFGIPNLRVTDGPNGARGSSLFGSGEARAVCVPCGSALGATWDPELVEEVGRMLGDETRTKQARVLLAPTVNLHRSPLGGRNFECYSEDPLLSGKIAAGFVRGVQSRGVATTVKHFVGNDAETERNTVNSIIDDRTLRELYLLPFEIAVREGGALGIMSAYNRLNGTYCTEDRELLTKILREDWGFEGFVMTDWFSATDTVNSINAGLDIEMPGNGRGFGPALADAVRNGLVEEHRLDQIVLRQLTVLGLMGALDDEPGPEQSIDRPEHRALARRTASDAMVLLKNDGVLPFALDTSGSGSGSIAGAAPMAGSASMAGAASMAGSASMAGAGAGSVKTLAVIGPNANRTQLMGGGSANLRPMHRTSILEAVRSELGDRITVLYEPGCSIDRMAPSFGGASLTAPDGEPGLLIDIFANDAWTGPIAGTIRRDSGKLLFMDAPMADVDQTNFSFRARGVYRAVVSGTHSFEIIQMGHSRLFIDGRLVLDGVTTPPGPGSSYFGMGSETIAASLDLVAGEPHDIVVEYRTAPGVVFTGVDVGCRPPLPTDPIGAAAAAAASADAVVLVVGTNDDWESEGEDRSSMNLPGDQDELVARVLAANPNTVVVVNTGSPVTMDWATERCAILQAWFGGQEMAHAVLDVITGASEPGGRLPTTFPAALEHNPSFGNFPIQRGEVRYGEGVYVGYRWYQTRRLPVRFPFGHGLSYTSFTVGQPQLSTDVFTVGSTVTVRVDVTNTGSRSGSEVVQCYITPPSPTGYSGALSRPHQELKAFAKVRLGPGETTTVTLKLDNRSFAYWDPADVGWSAQREHVATSMVITPMPDRNETPGWRIEPGNYYVRIGTSSENITGTATLSVVEGALLPPTA